MGWSGLAALAKCPEAALEAVPAREEFHRGLGAGAVNPEEVVPEAEAVQVRPGPSAPEAEGVRLPGCCWERDSVLESGLG